MSKVEELLNQTASKQLLGATGFYSLVVRPQPAEEPDPGVPSQDKTNPDIKIITTSKDIALQLLRRPPTQQYDILYAICQEALGSPEGFTTIEYKDRTFLASLDQQGSSRLVILHIS